MIDKIDRLKTIYKEFKRNIYELPLNKPESILIAMFSASVTLSLTMPLDDKKELNSSNKKELNSKLFLLLRIIIFKADL